MQATRLSPLSYQHHNSANVSIYVFKKILDFSIGSSCAVIISGNIMASIPIGIAHIKGALTTAHWNKFIPHKAFIVQHKANLI